MEKNNLLILVGISLILGVILYRCQKGSGDGHQANSSRIIGDAEVLSRKKQTKGERKEQKKQKRLVRKRQQEFLRKADLGINGVTFPVKDDKLQVSVIFKPVPVCHRGDYNMISHDMKISRQKSLSLVLENPHDGGFKRQSQRIKLRNLRRGFKKVFKLPTNLKGEVLGVFVCSDRDKTGTCRDKYALDLNRVLTHARKTARIDKIYLFNLLLVSGKKVEFLTESLDKSAQYKKLKKYLARDYKPGDLKSIIKRIVKLSRRLKSYPPDSSKGRLVVKIPYGNYKACRR